MRILFMGTPDIAAECLNALLENGFDVAGVVTQPDKPRGRGHKLMPSEVKVAAQKNSIPVYQPESLKNGELKPVLDEIKPDVIAVVAYGKILPEYVLNYPEKGCINVHASLLPKLRGAAPIQWAVIGGLEKTGITTMKMDKGLDTGDMLLTKELTIGEYETSEELFAKMAVEGGKLLVKTLENLDSIKPTPQDDSKSSYAPMITKETARIDWSKPTEVISKLVCGMNCYPMAWTTYKGEAVKVITALKGGRAEGEPGQICGFEKDKGLKVITGDGSIYIQTIQFAGGKRMSVSEYLKGHSIENIRFI